LLKADWEDENIAAVVEVLAYKVIKYTVSLTAIVDPLGAGAILFSLFLSVCNRRINKSTRHMAEEGD
jgi:hypothetical protein